MRGCFAYPHQKYIDFLATGGSLCPRLIRGYGPLNKEIKRERVCTFFNILGLERLDKSTRDLTSRLETWQFSAEIGSSHTFWIGWKLTWLRPDRLGQVLADPCLSLIFF